MKEELYIRRSIPECMGTAWTLMSTNLGRMVRGLWLPSVIMALLCALVSVVGYRSFLWLFLETVALVVAQLFIDAKIYRLVNLQSTSFCFERVAKAFAVNLIMAIVAIVLLWGVAAGGTLLAMSGKLATTVALVLGIVLVVVLLVLMLIFFTPMLYPLTKYIVEPEMKFKGIMKAYRRALKCVGFVVTFFLLCMVVLVLCYGIVALPSVIVNTATVLSFQGVALGDAPGLPKNFPIIVAITTFVTTFVVVLLRVWSVFATYYMYASIEEKYRSPEPTEDLQE